MTEVKEVTEKLQAAVATAWFAQACISPEELNDPGSKAAFLRLRECLNQISGMTGFPPKIREFNTVALELAYEKT